MSPHHRPWPVLGARVLPDPPDCSVLISQVGQQGQSSGCAQCAPVPCDLLTHRPKQSTEQKPPKATGFVNLDHANHRQDQGNLFQCKTEDHSCPEDLAMEDCGGTLQCACGPPAPAPCVWESPVMPDPHPRAPQDHRPGAGAASADLPTGTEACPKPWGSVLNLTSLQQAGCALRPQPLPPKPSLLTHVGSKHKAWQ